MRIWRKYRLFKWQKQPSRNVLIKRCSENMQQIYSGTPMLKCDFNKLQICCIFLEHLFLRTCLEGVFWYTNIMNTSSFNDKYSSLNTFCNLIIKKDYFDLRGDVNIIILISILLIIVLVDWLSLKGVNHIHDYLYFHVHVFIQLLC